MFLQKISLNEEAQVYNVVLNRIWKRKRVVKMEEGGWKIERYKY